MQRCWVEAFCRKLQTPKQKLKVSQGKIIYLHVSHKVENSLNITQ